MRKLTKQWLMDSEITVERQSDRQSMPRAPASCRHTDTLLASLLQAGRRYLLCSCRHKDSILALLLQADRQSMS
jgi:hypothetical protein